jgi:acyl-CoA synthetase (AMP-forming)/AMP-acid ligase II
VAEAHHSEAEAVRAAVPAVVMDKFALGTHEVVLVPQGTIPRTSSGKPQRRKTRQMYLEGTLPKIVAATATGAQAGVAASSG